MYLVKQKLPFFRTRRPYLGSMKALDYWLSDKTTTTAIFISNFNHFSGPEVVEKMVKMGAGFLHFPVGNFFDKYHREARRAVDILGPTELKEMMAKFGGLPLNASPAVLKRLAKNSKFLKVSKFCFITVFF